jgi:uncharacterized membrane protein (UPF0127 family)
MESGYIYIHNNVFPTLLAISMDEQTHGLMGEAWPPPVMSFLYTCAQVNRFWMKQTPSPLDIVFCCNGIVTQICKGEPYSTSTIGDDRPSDLVIEFPFGTVISAEIKLGHKVGLLKPTKEELRNIMAEKYYDIIKN